jgi:DNA (cytosine-5)-methyltransferase 1
MKPQIFAFFSGAGFLDLGFEDAGFELVFANELQKSFLKGHQHARSVMGRSEPRFGYSGKSITDFVDNPLLHSHLVEMIKAAKSTGEKVGFIGGPPCPDFSVGGKNKGRDGENGKLSATYVSLICEQKPDFFLFENVKGLWRTKRHREFFEELKSKLRRAGYRTTEKLINSLEFGVPQERERIILIGIRDIPENRDMLTRDLQSFPWNRHTPYRPQVLSKISWPECDAFYEGERKQPYGIPEELTVEYWFKRNKVDKHPNALHHFQPRAGLARFQSVSEGDDSKKSFKRLHRWRYSPTACYGNNEVHLHPYKARRISVAEALAIQSLPSNFELPSDMSLSDMFKTVGNGVPFLAAKGLAHSILDFLREYYAKTDCLRLVARDSATAQESRIQLHQP